ncbi:MAG: hypothetical protein GIX03_00530 [Candidatus Eremiobacteraeota bacterium]|nr:hypothetical protein [Candidatus Eremiobacteraeota bacterium]MBC5801508.1 hypothetical protein [Candidatus Eremiobacteraeota bacterium]MBC5821099.1 hypothetical protein [Candidatus Eremiobacteraeota bacterium]
MAFLVALVVFITNIGRLGQHNAAMAIMALMIAGLAYLCIWPIVSLMRAKPRPGVIAFVLAGVYVVAFAYAFAGFFITAPASLPAFLLGFAVLWCFMICYRGVVFPSIFGREGGIGPFRERTRVIREARRASKAESEDLIASIRHKR